VLHTERPPTADSRHFRVNGNPCRVNSVKRVTFGSFTTE
jgi:hypothetical protein